MNGRGAHARARACARNRRDRSLVTSPEMRSLPHTKSGSCSVYSRPVCPLHVFLVASDSPTPTPTPKPPPPPQSPLPPPFDFVLALVLVAYLRLQLLSLLLAAAAIPFVPEDGLKPKRIAPSAPSPLQKDNKAHDATVIHTAQCSDTAQQNTVLRSEAHKHQRHLPQPPRRHSRTTQRAGRRQGPRRAPPSESRG